MDPLSVTASIVAVSGAACSISAALWRIIETVRLAPKEMGDLASEMTVLSAILQHLRDVIDKGKGVYKPAMVKDLRAVLKRIRDTQREIQGMIKNSNALERLKWFFKAPNVKKMCQKIEVQKNTISLMLNVMLVATHQKEASRKNEDALKK
jgi:hypothetical protein